LFGITFVGKYKGADVAVKKTEQHQMDRLLLLMQQIDLRNDMGSHPNLVNLVGVHFQRLLEEGWILILLLSNFVNEKPLNCTRHYFLGTLFVVEELCTQGNLMPFLNEMKNNEQEPTPSAMNGVPLLIQLTTWACQIAAAMECLETKNVRLCF